MFASDARLLLRLWLRAPRRIATAAPSGRAVCNALIDDATNTRARDGWVIELGAGTGPVTRQLLARGRRQRFEGCCSLRAGQQPEGHRQRGGVVVHGGHGVEVSFSLASVSPSIRRWRACAEASGS
ncbi:MAG: hypothetical protein CMN26_10115, partial [Salinisphaera sp.]